MRSVSIATTQMSCTADRAENIRRACALVEEAAARGAQIVLLQELFETPYFCIERDPRHFAEATPLAANPAVAALKPLAARLKVVVPVCFYELGDDGKRYNSVAIIDADGSVLGIYRKSHIPDFPAYEEAFYFAPGNTGFKVWDTAYARIGVGICWDQWFPEAARIMALEGAEILLYPTAIGRPVRGETNEARNSKPHWQQAMQGHAAANQVIVAAANRIGNESGGQFETQFYGGSFIADPTGGKVLELGETMPGVGVMSFDLDEYSLARHRWGIYRTRRRDLYEPVLTRAAPDYLMVRRDD
ncbi:MAG: carbon-nitrogen hydrolase [Rhodobacteraceae bacterium]|jgi:N-carbamoylputrescine amidase|nr:carbon-nitrogen hydrolase [Paracoccaceae bacterium]